MIMTKKKIGISISALILVCVTILCMTVPAFAASKKLTADEAKTIALTHAGVTEDAVTFVKTASYTKNKIKIFDIEFKSSTKKYSYEINAVTGDVEACYIKSINGSSSGSSSTLPNLDSFIGEAEAKAIALEHAGLAESSVKKMKCKLDREHGQYVYEVEFDCGWYEYEYEIHAETGEILDWEWDD